MNLGAVAILLPVSVICGLALTSSRVSRPMWQSSFAIFRYERNPCAWSLRACSDRLLMVYMTDLVHPTVLLVSVLFVAL